MDEFIDEPIQVESEPRMSNPKTFTWRGASYQVAEVMQAWQDWSVPAFAKHARGWLHRRHRNCFVIRTTDDQIFELYLDRGFGKRDWVLLKRRAQ
ncbi:MAG: hypothetical protein HZC40_02125 [Chloroflexi bacterium]|nr:hypothetical protein [Chloroflexota bacterium]